MDRIRAGAGIVLVCCALGASAAAQSEERDAGPPSVRVRIVRPPEGSMQRGTLPVPAWAVYVGGGVVVAGAAGFLAWRTIRRR